MKKGRGPRCLWCLVFMRSLSLKSVLYGGVLVCILLIWHYIVTLRELANSDKVSVSSKTGIYMYMYTRRFVSIISIDVDVHVDIILDIWVMVKCGCAGMRMLRRVFCG